MKPHPAIVPLAALLLLGACHRAQEEEAAGPTAEVVTVAAAARPVEQVVAGYGQVEFAPARAASLVVEVESQVTAVLTTPGARVRRGEGLLRLRPSAVTRLEVDRAAREATLAAGEARRLARLREEGLATDAEAQAAKAAAETAERLRDSLAERSGGGHEYLLAAPRDGIVDALAAQPGDLLAAGSTVARIGDPQGLQARIGLESADAARVVAGAAARVTVLGSGAEPVTGRVAAVEARLDKDSRLAAALVALPPAAGLMPGVPVAGRIVVAVRAEAVAVPHGALVHDGNDTIVYVVAGGKAQRRVVQAGLDDGEFVEIQSGLKAGEAVATTGSHELKDGMGVRAPRTEAQKAAAASVKPAAEQDAK
jgi:RND family efflux transporter MFP subunit